MGCGAGALGAEGGCWRVEVGVEAGIELFDCEAKMMAVSDAPAAAEPAAMSANVVFDMFLLELYLDGRQSAHR